MGKLTDRELTDLILLTHEAIDLSAIDEAVRDPGCGAVLTFVGTSRDVHHGRAVAQLSYEAYEPMAEKGLRKLAVELRETFPGVARLALVHRLGDVPIAEASVAVAVSTPHRGEAFEACRYGIDRLKAEVPVWKKEFYRDGGDPRWVANCEAGPGHEPTSKETTEVST